LSSEISGPIQAIPQAGKQIRPIQIGLIVVYVYLLIQGIECLFGSFQCLDMLVNEGRRCALAVLIGNGLGLRSSRLGLRNKRDVFLVLHREG